MTKRGPEVMGVLVTDANILIDVEGGAAPLE